LTEASRDILTRVGAATTPLIASNALPSAMWQRQRGVFMSAAAGAAAAAATAQAIKASGAIVSVEPSDFLTILQRQQSPLVIHATGGFFKTNYQYLTSYKGLAFYTKSPDPLNLPSATELVLAKSIWIPG
jgi:hypothetical protein